VEAAMLKLRRARTPEMLKSGADALEKALEDEPDNVEGLLTLVQVLQYLAKELEGDEATEPMIHKSVALLDKTTQADPDLLENPGFKRFAATVYYSDARALAREKQLPNSLASLRKAAKFGATNFDEMEAEKDLAAVRELPEFAPFAAEAKERIKVAAETEVAQLFEENEPFEFTFALEDIAGNKLSKAELAGKVLIVDIWGTWCPPCRMEIPHFVALDKEYREKGLQIVGLNQERGEDDAENIKMVKEFCEENDVPYPCALITEEVMKQVPDFEGFPTTLFLDRAALQLRACKIQSQSQIDPFER
jgi:thiol-disulfide isomerase/thioredoxin